MPAGHVVHEEEPLTEYVPAKQVRQDPAPVPEYCPAGQFVQLPAFPVEKVPALQMLHCVDPAREYSPLPQGKHEEGSVAPAVDEYVPAAHGLQAPAGTNIHVPAGHWVHPDDPAGA